MTIKTFKALEKIVEKHSETEMTEWGYDGIIGYVKIEGNPYEGQIWNVISELRYIENITKVELKPAEDKNYDNDILDIDFIEIRPKRTLEEYKAILGLEL